MKRPLLTRAPWADNKLYKVADSSAQVSFICLVERLIPFCVILLNEVQVHVYLVCSINDIKG